MSCDIIQSRDQESHDFVGESLSRSHHSATFDANRPFGNGDITFLFCQKTYDQKDTDQVKGSPSF